MKMLEKQKKIFEGAVAKGYFLGVTDAEGELVLAATNNVEAVVGAVEGAGEVDVWVYDEEGCFRSPRVHGRFVNSQRCSRSFTRFNNRVVILRSFSWAPPHKRNSIFIASNRT